MRKVRVNWVKCAKCVKSVQKVRKKCVKNASIRWRAMSKCEQCTKCINWLKCAKCVKSAQKVCEKCVKSAQKIRLCSARHVKVRTVYKVPKLAKVRKNV